MKMLKLAGMGILLAAVVFSVPLTALAQDDPEHDKIAEIISNFEFYVDEVDCIIGSGKPGKSAVKRLDAFSTMLYMAQYLIDLDYFYSACDPLWSAFWKSDGKHPPDFIEEVEDCGYEDPLGTINDGISDLLEMLECIEKPRRHKP